MPAWIELFGYVAFALLSPLALWLLARPKLTVIATPRADDESRAVWIINRGLGSIPLDYRLELTCFEFEDGSGSSSEASSPTPLVTISGRGAPRTLDRSGKIDIRALSTTRSHAEAADGAQPTSESSGGAGGHASPAETPTILFKAPATWSLCLKEMRRHATWRIVLSKDVRGPIHVAVVPPMQTPTFVTPRTMEIPSTDWAEMKVGDTRSSAQTFALGLALLTVSVTKRWLDGDDLEWQLGSLLFAMIIAFSYLADQMTTPREPRITLCTESEPDPGT